MLNAVISFYLIRDQIMGFVLYAEAIVMAMIGGYYLGVFKWMRRGVKK